MNPTEQCPKCGNYAEGHPIGSSTGKTTQVLETVGVFFDALVGDDTWSGQDEYNGLSHSQAGYAFRCAKCGHTWMKNGNEPLYPSDEIIRQHKQKKVNRYWKRCVNTGGGALFTGAISAGSFYYCYTNESATPRKVEGNFFSFYQDFTVYDWNYLWYFLAFVFLIAGFISLIYIVCFIFAQKKYTAVKKYSLHPYYDKYMR